MAACKRLSLGATRLLLAAAFFGLGGCKIADKQVDASALRDFAFDAKAKNFAILAGNDGASIGSPLAGVPTDIQTWWSLLCQDKPFQSVTTPGAAAVKCAGGILGDYEIVYANKTGTTAAGLKAAMDYVGRNLEETSTLIVVYSGHGTESGDLILTPASPWAPFGEALAAAARTRGKRAARFYFFNDSCYSGKSVTDEKQAVTSAGKASNALTEGQILPLIPDGFFGRDLGTPAGGGPSWSLADDPATTGLNAEAGLVAASNAAATTALATQIAPLADESADQNPAFAQAVIFSSANEQELAGDEGAALGGTFTSRLKVAIEHFQAQYRPGDQTTNPSLQRVFNAVARHVQETSKAKGNPQVPQYRVTPECVLQEKFFMTGQPPLCAAPKY